MKIKKHKKGGGRKRRKKDKEGNGNKRGVGRRSLTSERKEVELVFLFLPMNNEQQQILKGREHNVRTRKRENK
jgi:hypothetical protein